MMAIQSRGKLLMVEPSNLFAGTIPTVKKQGKIGSGESDF